MKVFPMKILLAIDRSSGADSALQRVVVRPWPAEARIRVLTVVEQDLAEAPHGVEVPSEPLGEVPPWPEGTLRTIPMLEADARTLVESAVAKLASHGLSAEWVVRAGAAGREIVEEAEAWRADLVIVGASRHGAVMRMLLGSVADYVVREASCSVEVVRTRA
jgi:nucleotide-binding universal stress UspA family protein